MSASAAASVTDPVDTAHQAWMICVRDQGIAWRDWQRSTKRRFGGSEERRDAADRYVAALYKEQGAAALYERALAEE